MRKILFAVFIALGAFVLYRYNDESVSRPDSGELTQPTEKTNVDGTIEEVEVSNNNDQARGRLDLSSQGLTEVPAYVFKLTELESINLSNNKLDGALQAEIRQLSNLKTLDLSDNEFTGVPAEIGQLTQLEVLDLSNNFITGLPYELGNLAHLKTLDLRGNNYARQDLEEIRKSLPSGVVIEVD